MTPLVRSSRCCGSRRRRRPGSRCRSRRRRLHGSCRARSTGPAWRRGRSPSRRARPPTPGDLAGRRVDAARHIAGDHDRVPPACALIASIAPAARLARLAREAGAEDRVDDRGGVLRARSASNGSVAGPRSRSRFVRASPRSSLRVGQQQDVAPRGRARAAAAPPRARRRRCCPCRRRPRSALAARRSATSVGESRARALHQVEPGDLRAASIAHWSSARCCSASGSGSSQSVDEVTRASADRRLGDRDRDSRRVTSGVGQRDLAPAPRARPRGRAPPVQRDGRRGPRRRRPRRRASSTPSSRAPSPPPPWRRTAPPGAGPAAPARRRTRARQSREQPLREPRRRSSARSSRSISSRSTRSDSPVLTRP